MELRPPPPLVIVPEWDPRQEEEEAAEAEVEVEVEGLEVELMCSHLLLSASENPMAPRSNRPSHTGPI